MKKDPTLLIVGLGTIAIAALVYFNQQKAEAGGSDGSGGGYTVIPSGASDGNAPPADPGTVPVYFNQSSRKFTIAPSSPTAKQLQQGLQSVTGAGDTVAKYNQAVASYTPSQKAFAAQDILTTINTAKVLSGQQTVDGAQIANALLIRSVTDPNTVIQRALSVPGGSNATVLGERVDYLPKAGLPTGNSASAAVIPAQKSPAAQVDYLSQAPKTAASPPSNASSVASPPKASPSVITPKPVVVVSAALKGGKKVY